MSFLNKITKHDGTAILPNFNAPDDDQIGRSIYLSLIRIVEVESKLVPPGTSVTCGLL
jgi:hypothetical protein